MTRLCLRNSDWVGPGCWRLEEDRYGEGMIWVGEADKRDDDELSQNLRRIRWGVDAATKGATGWSEFDDEDRDDFEEEEEEEVNGIEMMLKIKFTFCQGQVGSWER